MRSVRRAGRETHKLYTGFPVAGPMPSFVTCDWLVGLSVLSVNVWALGGI